MTRPGSIPEFVAPFYGDGTSTTIDGSATVSWYQWPPHETSEEKAKRIVVNLILKGDFFPRDKEHLEKAIEIVKEGL